MPGSELKAHRYLTRDSGLDEVMGTEFSNLDIKQLYIASDLLLTHKQTIEEKLYQREKELFNLNEVVTLFDITNTYFEGHNNHSKVAMGRSKEKRSDCDLISLGLLLDGSGFPKKSQILAGNISEPCTLKEMLSTLNANPNTTIIMDAGIATLENIAYVTQEGYTYIVVKRDSDLVMPTNDHVIVKDTVRNKVTVSLVTNDNDTINLYCHSTAKELKTIEFINKMAVRFEEELTKITHNLLACDLYAGIHEYDITASTAIILPDGQVFTNKPDQLITMIIKVENPTIGSEFSLDSRLTSLLQSDEQILKLCSSWYGKNVKIQMKLQSKLRNLFALRLQSTTKNATREYDKIAMRIGKLKQVYKSVAHLYDIQIIPDRIKHYARAITYIKNTTLAQKKQAGIYCLTSNRKDLSAEQLWHTYTMLTDIESAFRSLKSELGMRPIYHQLERRIDGHIFITENWTHLKLC